MYSSLVLVLCASMANSAWGRHLSNNAVFDQVYSLPCDLPQPRAFAVHELTGDIFTYSPPFIVLHRCESSGCCEDQNQSCQPDETEDVTLSIKFDNNGELDRTVVKATNHTRCICLETINTIK
ncbi:hypothetical protein GWI33_019863 [Rhynchophorus ferrugineus]|uniref:Platelet-derived growth factor (PDGF) family profile domain-containing protein n=1 Tax=Rhynchophorus ferrugineus TaxID=354439 RepID=A0A834M4U0_RHYFE|nr:hypothetical protein GWI33_019863 [Rhynchophorus ferrugineus]